MKPFHIVASEGLKRVSLLIYRGSDLLLLRFCLSSLVLPPVGFFLFLLPPLSPEVNL